MTQCDMSENKFEINSPLLIESHVEGITIVQNIRSLFHDILGAAPGWPGLAPAPPGPPAGLGPWNPNLGGGVLSFLASLDLFLTTLEWMAQLTQ